MMKLGLIQYNAGNDEAALSVYKKVVSQYGSTAQRSEALQAIRNIYVEQGNAEGFLSYSKTVPNVNISTNEQDSISYQAAYSMYLKGDCDKGIATFGNYLTNFPQGQFTNDAHFYRRSEEHTSELPSLLRISYAVFCLKKNNTN